MLCTMGHEQWVQGCPCSVPGDDRGVMIRCFPSGFSIKNVFIGDWAAAGEGQASAADDGLCKCAWWPMNNDKLRLKDGSLMLKLQLHDTRNHHVLPAQVHRTTSYGMRHTRVYGWYQGMAENIRGPVCGLSPHTTSTSRSPPLPIPSSPLHVRRWKTTSCLTRNL